MSKGSESNVVEQGTRKQGMFTTTCIVPSCVWNVSAKKTEPTQVRKMSIAEYKQLKESKHFFMVKYLIIACCY